MRLHLRKKHIFIGIAACVILFILIYGGMQVMGGQKKSNPIPDQLQGAYIMFNQPMFYEIGRPEEETGTFQKIGRHITGNKSLSKYYPNRFTYESVPDGMKFTVIGSESNWSYGLAAIDSGSTPIDYLLLQDENGNKAFISYIEFTTNIDEDRTLTDVHSASYYKDGKKIDDVVLPIFPEVK